MGYYFPWESAAFKPGKMLRGILLRPRRGACQAPAQGAPEAEQRQILAIARISFQNKGQREKRHQVHIFA
jgi:hypothetical protein